MLFYDSETESFWSQMTGSAVVGPSTGARLRWLPSEVTTWGAWRKAHPRTTVVRRVPGITRYGDTHAYYSRYRKGGRPIFPMKVDVGDRYEQMAVLTVVLVDGKPRGYPHRELAEGMNRDGRLTIEKRGISVVIRDPDGKQIPTMTAYWFAWCAFYKDGFLYRRPAAR